MKVDLPAPFGPATTTRAGAPSATAARSDPNGGTLTLTARGFPSDPGVDRNERPTLEAPARPATVRRDLNHAVGVVRIAAVDRRPSGADFGLDGLAIGVLDEPHQYVVNLLRA